MSLTVPTWIAGLLTCGMGVAVLGSVKVALSKRLEIDEARVREEVEALKARRFEEDLKAHQRELEREKAQEEKDLRSEPERVILNYAELLLAGGLKFLRATLLESLRKGLKALLELERPREVVKHLAATIRSWAKYREQLKDQMVELLYAEYEALRTTA